MGHARGHRPRHRRDAPARRGRQPRPRGRGPQRPGAHAHGPGHPAGLRRRGAVGDAHGGRAVGRGRARRPAPAHAGRHPRRGHGHGGRVRRRGRRPRAVHARLAPLPPPGARAGPRLPRPRADRRLLARVVGGLDLRRRVAGGGRRLAARAQGADLRPHRRHRRRRHDLAARGARRRAQLGLPLLLDPRRHPDLVRPGPVRLRRGGAGLPRLAPARLGRRGRPAPDHVRGGGRAAPARAGARVAAGLRGRVTGARRQRRRRPVPARRLRRDARPRLARRLLAATGPAHRLEAAGRDDRVPRGGGAPARRGDLGGARPAPPLRALQGHGLGRVRPGREDRRQRRARGPARALAAHPRRAAHRDLLAGLRRRAQHVHAVLRLARARRLAADHPHHRLPAPRRPARGRHHRGGAARAAAGRLRVPLPHR